jgi:hypothetical protein
MVILPMSFKVQLNNMRGCFDAPRFEISCKFEGKIVVE